MSADTNPFVLDRRSFLGQYAGCLGGLALASLLGDQTNATTKDVGTDPALTRKAPHFPPKAKSVICLFQHGGPSQMDLFDPKPMLTKHAGKPYDGDLEVHFHEQKGNVLASPFQFSPAGECGMELSEILPHTAGIADEITLVRSMATESVDHEAALRLIHTGKIFAGRPVLGSWVLYGLGTERQDLPAYVVLGDPGGLPVDGIKNWTSGFLPASYQGTVFRAGDSPVANLRPPGDLPESARKGQLQFLEKLNRIHHQRFPESSELAARLSHFELAAQMQTSVPEILDISGESEETQKLYGLDNPKTEEYGKRCLLARRLIENGVRFVQVFLSGQPWDTHSNNAGNLRDLCGRADQPSAALVTDLKRRGLLDSTIVLWTGEFGRLPISQGSDGRDHNRHAFSLWLAGGGFRKGYVHGATDDFGYAAVEKVVQVHDLHATLFHALGLDHRRLTFPHDGRPDSLTDADVTGAKVIHELFG